MLTKRKVCFILTVNVILVCGYYVLNKGIPEHRGTIQSMSPINVSKFVKDRREDEDHLLREKYGNILEMIIQIEKSDQSRKGLVLPEPMPYNNCSQHRKYYKGTEDLFCMTPPILKPEVKNPCWLDPRTKQFKCLPYFQVIGMDKSGSTDLFDKIACHPHVLKNRGILQKETQWWSWKRYGHFLKRRVPKQSFAHYLMYFEDAAFTIQANQGIDYITGDGTPMDLWDMSEWDQIPQNDGLSEPRVTTAHLIRHMNPGVKLIVIFRDPVERLFSDYFFLGLGQMNIQAFHDEVLTSIRLLHTCTRTASLRACLYNRKLLYDITARIHLGFYPIFMRDWLKVFPREQFLIFRTRDYSNNTVGTLKKTYQFLGLQELSEKKLTNITMSQKRHVTQRKKHLKMHEDTRLILERLYRNFNKDLAELLQDENFLFT